MDIKSGSTDQTVSFAAWTTATGAAVTVTSATAGLSLWYRRGSTGAKTAISPSDLAGLDSAHSDGGIKVIEGQEHRLDLPDAAVADGVTFVEWGGSATGITIDGGRANLIGQANTSTDVSHIKAQAVTCAAPVTVRADVGAAAAPGAANGMLIGGSNAATTFATLTSTGAFTCGSTVLGNTTMGTLTQTGAVSWGATTLSSLTVAGAVALQSTLTVTGAVTLSSTLGTGAVTFNSLAVTGALSVGTTTTLTGNVSLGGTLGVTGTTTFAAVNTGAIGITTLASSGTVTLNALTVTGALTAGTNSIPWNAAWDAEVESEVTDALVAVNLDHLLKTATAAADMTTEVSDNTILARILANGDTSAFDPSTDGLQPIRDENLTEHNETQTTLGNIGNVSAPSYAAPSSVTLTTYTNETNTYSNVDSLNNVYHSVSDSSGTLSITYNFTLDPDEQANSIFWSGRWMGTNDTLTWEIYDWTTAAYASITSRVGVSSDTNASDFTISRNIVAKYTSTAANGGGVAGKVQIRVSGTGLSSCTLRTDQLIIGKTASLRGITTGSTVTLAGGNTNQDYIGANWMLALGGQDISGSYFQGAVSITGTATGSTPATFVDCQFGTGAAGATLPPGTFIRCGFNTPSGQPFTAASAGQYVFIDCYSLVAGSGTPYFDFSPVSSTTGVNFRRWSGGSNVTLDNNCTCTMEVVTGGGQTFTTGGANVEIRGTCRAVTAVLSASETVQVACVTGPITLSGTATAATVNLFGVHAAVANTSTGSTVNDYGVSLPNVNAEVDTALNTAIPGSPTADSINERIAAIDGKLPSATYLAGSSLSTGYLQKGTEVTGFNDIAATAIVSGGAITTSGGAVSSVTTVATTTNVTNAVTVTGKPAVTLASGDVTGNLPANVVQWNTGALPGVALEATLTARIPHAITQYQIGGTGDWYVGALTWNGEAIATGSDLTTVSNKLGTYTGAGLDNVKDNLVTVTGYVDCLPATLNNIAATDIVSNGPITTSGGAVSNVTTVGSVTGPVTVSGKPAVSLSSADVTGYLPANASQWNGGALPDVATATLVSAVPAATVAALGTGSTLTSLAPSATALSSVVWTNAKAGYLDMSLSDIPTAVEIRQEIDSNSTKTGYKLASDGLDSIPITSPTGVASNFRELIVQIWRRFFKRTTLTATQLKTYADDGVTVITTQAVEDDDITETQGPAT